MVNRDDDERLRQLLIEQGFSVDDIAEALQGKRDLLTLDQLRQKVRISGFDEEDIDAAIATVANRGTVLPKLGDRRLFTFEDFTEVQNEVIQRKLRRQNQDPTLQRVFHAMGAVANARHNGHTDALESAHTRLTSAIVDALQHGARVSDIATFAGITPDAVRKIRDRNL
ncbi:hypothetical protein [Antrihabitans spumae]|uniref:Uncharacterized protein n=1 Tax=Antrihabitans spumae TaxID=3373370 RepID=A0ABW7KIH0_9NOCA